MRRTEPPADGSGQSHGGVPEAQPRYIHGHHESVLRSHLWRTAANSAAYLLPHLKPGMDVLDVGCGPGNLTVDLAAEVLPGRVVGIDNAPDIIERARTSWTGAAATFEVADVYHLDYPDRSFDVVHAHQVLQHLPDPVAALVEMGRVARPGGLVAARDSDYKAMTWYPANPGLDRWLDLYERIARANRGEPNAARHLLAWAHRAGFTDVTSSASTWCFASPDDRAWWGGLWADRIVSSALAEQALDLSLASRADLNEIAEGWRRWAAEPDGWFALVHGEVLCRIPVTVP
jgi:ubiquinone/menaquinone biosynthesis C-methylase UbiE